MMNNNQGNKKQLNENRLDNTLSNDKIDYKTIIETLKRTVNSLRKKNELLEKQLSECKNGKIKRIGTPISKEVITRMREYAISIVDSESNFYRSIANKFNVSSRTAHNYCKDIKG